MERIREQQLSTARHRDTGELFLVDVPTDLAYVILQGRRGTRCVNTWDEIQHYDFE